MHSFTKIIPLGAAIALFVSGAALADKDVHSSVHTNPHGGVVGQPATHIDVDRANPHANPHGKIVGKHHAKLPNVSARIVTITPTNVTVRLRSGALQTYAITPAQYLALKTDGGQPIVFNTTGGTFLIVNP
ncbi:MAG: hypothetical protein NVSMB31_09010 [Vulcanimicrobiaceae bacterium]